MAADNTFNEILKIIVKALKRSGGGFSLDDVVKNYDELWQKLGEREKMVRDMKETAQKAKILAKEWVPKARRLDYVTTSERDMRIRYRGRVEALTLHTKTAELAGEAPLTFAKEMSKIESGE